MKRLNKKANITIYIVFVLTAIITIIMGAVIVPMGTVFSVKAYEAGEKIMIIGNESTTSISDTAVREKIQANIGAGLDNSDYNVEITTNLFKYSWIIVLGLTALIMFLFTRKMVEYGAGGFI